MAKANLVKNPPGRVPDQQQAPQPRKRKGTPPNVSTAINKALIAHGENGATFHMRGGHVEVGSHVLAFDHFHYVIQTPGVPGVRVLLKHAIDRVILNDEVWMEAVEAMREDDDVE